MLNLKNNENDSMKFAKKKKKKKSKIKIKFQKMKDTFLDSMVEKSPRPPLVYQLKYINKFLDAKLQLWDN